MQTPKDRYTLTPPGQQHPLLPGPVWLQLRPAPDISAVSAAPRCGPGGGRGRGPFMVPDDRGRHRRRCCRRRRCRHCRGRWNAGRRRERRGGAPRRRRSPGAWRRGCCRRRRCATLGRARPAGGPTLGRAGGGRRRRKRPLWRELSWRGVCARAAPCRPMWRDDPGRHFLPARGRPCDAGRRYGRRRLPGSAGAERGRGRPARLGPRITAAGLAAQPRRAQARCGAAAAGAAGSGGLQRCCGRGGPGLRGGAAGSVRGGAQPSRGAWRPAGLAAAAAARRPGRRGGPGWRCTGGGRGRRGGGAASAGGGRCPARVRGCARRRGAKQRAHASGGQGLSVVRGSRVVLPACCRP